MVVSHHDSYIHDLFRTPYIWVSIKSTHLCIYIYVTSAGNFFSVRVSQQSSGQKVLIAGALTSALRLHQRMPQFRLNREFLTALLAEDSAHYLLYSVLMLYTAQPVSCILSSICLFYVYDGVVFPCVSSVPILGVTVASDFQ